nr:GLIPR1-like protein 1 [Lytechinus pictus]
MKLMLISLTFIMALVQGDIDVGAGVHRHRAKRTETAFSQEEIEGIVNLHNEYRGMVTPEASNMKHMRWDDNLARMAQIWSDGCVFAHGNPDIMTDFQYVGQNLWAGSIFDNGLGATAKWYNETVDYDYNTGTCAPGKVCGHYTQGIVTIVT